MPKVSICIPAYNQVNYLRKTVDSVLEQTYTDYEIIITDDSSTDIVKNLVDEYGLPALIKYYKNGRALGTPENWNEAIRKASGEYIKILHHDDWFSSTESLLKYVSLLDENPESDFVFAATKAIAPGLQQWEHVITDADVTALQSNPLLLYRNNFIGAPSTVMFRKRSFLPFDNNLKWLVDVDQYIRMIDDNKNIRYSSETLVVTCLPEGRVSDDCKDNKAVEVYEYLYLLNAFCNRKKNYDPAELRSCFLKAIVICDKHIVSRRNDVVRCGYEKKLPGKLQTYLLLKSSFPLLARAYKKILRDTRSKVSAY